MSLDLGELRIALELDNDKFRAGLAGTKKELEGIPPAARREMVKVSRVFDEEGRKSGGLLARGINSGLMRNSPLIVAGVSAALVAGAPIMLAAAGTLFAGIGAVAAAQSLEVRQAWTSMGREVRDGAVSDAAVLVPVYVEMAGKIGAAFQQMRPQLREAFAGSAPLVRSFTGGVIDLAENAMPGLVRAVQSGQPVFAGLEHFLAATGTGLTDFFDAMSSHSPAAGAAFGSLGDIMGNLLPILGELLGQGAELASDVLPAVTMATGLTLDVLQLLGPLLPTIAIGFGAFKVAGAVSPMVAKLAQNLAMFSYSGGTAGATAGKMSTAVAGLGRALPLAALAMGAFTVTTEKNEGRIGDWTDALLRGGAGADALREKANAARDASFWDKAKGAIFFQDLWDDDWSGNVTEDYDEAKKAADEYMASLTPQARAAEEVKKATAGLADAVDKYGAESPEAAKAAAGLTAAQVVQERAASELELAMHGVTAAMIEQADQALAAIDSGFAYRKAIDDLEDAQGDLNIAIAEQGVNSETAQRAQLALEQQAYNTALAFGQQQADLTGLSADSLEYKRIVQEEMLRELVRLRDAAGPEMKAAYDQQIAAMQASGVTMVASSAEAAKLAGQMRDVGLSVREIPGQRFVQIDAPTAQQRADIDALGYKVLNLPNGETIVYADTGPARAELASFLYQRTVKTVEVFLKSTFGAAGGGPVIGRAGGGRISGPGTTTSDSIPAMGPGGQRYALSNDEHIVTAAEVQAAGGHGAVLEIRKAMLAGAFRYADGGPVPRREAAATAVMDRRDGPLFHADQVNVIEGTPQDIAQELAYQGRTRGW